ncbi:uncharacterized protein Gasu_66120 [Galdieria sulphuraria]|uniref:Uncharacterized protein n=1 Tax=Galdieria sulphuraria TaxID=130081 RepID=M2XQ27_GALSU|nr:uncharacterized protein Gasu_66120 [Galdieria sulphuraria]EME25728.1 hypothetical protein Gasu_66120 [Galdieria sulphuraria]|eukprot:XP_005702248.1 hypothetical protein Gasu_66120 [Galdieria sulphuraria]
MYLSYLSLGKKQERVLQRYDEFIKRGRVLLPRLESQFHPIVLVEYSFSSKQLDWFWYDMSLTPNCYCNFTKCYLFICFTVRLYFTINQSISNLRIYLNYNDNSHSLQVVSNFEYCFKLSKPPFELFG